MAKKKSKKEEELTIKDILDVLVEVYNNEKYEKIKPSPKFSYDEAKFIIDYIFYKPYLYKNLPGIIAGNLVENNFQGFYINGPTVRRLNFIKYLLTNGGISAKAAIQSGYSPRCAKQQGYRVLKFLQGRG